MWKGDATVTIQTPRPTNTDGRGAFSRGILYGKHRLGQGGARHGGLQEAGTVGGEAFGYGKAE